MGRKKAPSTVYELLQEAGLRYGELLAEYENSFEVEFFKAKVRKIRRDFEAGNSYLGRLLDHLEVAKKEIIVVSRKPELGEDVYRVTRLAEGKRDMFIDAILDMDVSGKDETDVTL